MNPEELFKRARLELEQLAIGAASELAVQEVSSRSVMFVRPPETYRLSWDGKDEALILEWSPDEEQFRLGMWEDVALWLYPPDDRSDEVAFEILRELNVEFQSCLAQTGG